MCRHGDTTDTMRRADDTDATTRSPGIADRSTTASGAAGAAGAAEEPLPAGTQVGRYQVIRPIGAGGMGVVYEVLDEELGRRVALKLVATRALNSSEAQARLRREAQAMARLKHPNVITVYDIGTHGEQLFVAMDLVD